MYKTKYYENQKLRFTGQKRAVETYGLDVWSWMTDAVYCGDTFTIDFVCSNCPYIQHLAERTKKDYVTAIIKNIFKEYENNMQDCPIRRIGRAYLMV